MTERVRRLAVIGCGLMGGSFALALRRAGIVDRVAGYSRSGVHEALRLGVVDEACDSIGQAVHQADVVLVSVPVAATESSLRALVPHLATDALIMDVGSTKQDVVEAARRALGSRVSAFVPAHPIAGKERGGVEHAEAGLYAQRLAILTPLPENPSAVVQRAAALWALCGSTVQPMTPEAHDATYAAVSHLPHFLAFAYILGLQAQAESSRHLALAGPGFRDFSRIACSTSAIWRDIFRSNRTEVLQQLDAFQSALDGLRQALESGDFDTLASRIDAASAVRRAWKGTVSAAAEEPPALP